MNGELDFERYLCQRLSLLQGLSTDLPDGIAQRLVLTPGAER